MKHDVFISYSSKNKDVADGLCQYLEAMQLRCWIAPRNIRPGESYSNMIASAIADCKVYVFIVSKDSVTSQWCLREANCAVNANKILIPFRIDNCSMQEGMLFYFGNSQWLDAFPDPEKHFDTAGKTILGYIKKDESAHENNSALSVKRPVHPPVSRAKGHKLFYLALLLVGIISAVSAMILPGMTKHFSSSREPDMLKMTIGILEFENNSGREELEHLKKGIRDMITTDILRCKDITVVERSRIESVFREINFTKSKLFNDDESVAVGKLIGASHLLTGAYLLVDDTMRIDARLINVETGEIECAESIEGNKDDFFELEKKIVFAIVTTLKPDISSNEIQTINNMRTGNYAAFETYSKGVYFEEQGNIAEAIRLFQEASNDDQSFRMAKDKLSKLRESLSSRISASNEQVARNEKELETIMDSDFESCKEVCSIPNHSGDYYLSLLSLAIHYGLRADFQNERDTLLRFWKEFSVEEDASWLWKELQQKMAKKSLSFEKQLMITESSNVQFLYESMYFSEIAGNVYSFPRYSNIWPFCRTFGAGYPNISLDKCREEASFHFLPHDFFCSDPFFYPIPAFRLHDYYDNPPNDRTVSSSLNNPEVEDLTNLYRLDIESSIAEFYIRHPDIRIPKESFDSILERITMLFDKCSPFDDENDYTEDFALALLKRLSVVSPEIRENAVKLKFDQFMLALTKYVNNEPPGDITSNGLTISKTLFPGNHIVLIVSLDGIGPIMDLNYKDCLMKGLQSYNPNSYFNIVTANGVLFDEQKNASKDNISKAVSFLKENVYQFSISLESVSIAERIRDAYHSMPDDSESHIILVSNDAIRSFSDRNNFLDCFADKRKNIKFSIVITDSHVSLSMLKEWARNVDVDFLFRTAYGSGGGVYLQDKKVDLGY